MDTKLRIIIADDERPARLFLRRLLENFEDTEVVSEAENGAEAVTLIEELKPDLALLDLQMAEVGGLEAVKLLRRKTMPLVAFVTAYDEYAVQAFELNAIDYLLKPVESARLRETLNRAHNQLEQTDYREAATANLRAAVATYEETTRQPILERIPVKHNDEILLLPVEQVASVVADAELLHITTAQGKTYTINFRLKDLEARLPPEKFVRLSRGALVNLEMIARVSPLPGGTYAVTLKDNRQITASRLQSRIFRNQFLRM